MGGQAYAHCRSCGVMEHHGKVDEKCECGAGPLTFKYLSDIRNRKLVLSLSRAPNAGPGICTWCGHPIKFVDGVHHATRRRTRHYGDEKELGDRDCYREYLRSFAYSARELIYIRQDPCCVDCGKTGGYWEADHEIPLADGGPHTPANIKRRCHQCHKDKTKREAGERAARRRQAA